MDKDNYIGRLLDNRYEIQEVIGTGGMAVVYKARDHRLNRPVAIKILKDEYSRDEEFRRRFGAESQAVAMLSHPNIVSVYDVSTNDEIDYIVMELIDGITLKQYMEKKGVLNWKETLHFAVQIGKALEHAHSRGIVHRDIKPHNVMVLKNGSVKVTDFGIARVMSKSNTLTKEALGSVHYISPEQAKGGRVDNRSDIYSLGVVMYEMITGRPPYDGESPVAVAIKHINGGAPMPSTLNPNIPGGLEQIIMKAMAHEPNDRYESATAMLYDMDEFRKEPSMLFDYNTPPTDEVTNLHTSHLHIEQTPREPMTTAERVVAGRTEQPRTRPQTGRTTGTVSRNTSSGAYGSASRSTGTASSHTGGSVSRNTGSVARTSSASRTARNPEQSGSAPVRRRSQPQEDSPSKTATIAIVACSVVAIIAIIIFLVTLFGSGQTSTPETVSVPSLVGKDYSTLEAYDNLQIILQERVYDDVYASGQIVYQTPSAGDEVALGTKVYVDVSLGPEPEVKLMPDLVNSSYDNAEKVLVAMGMQVLPCNENSETVEAGYVTRTDPSSNVELKDGQIIRVYISQGPEHVEKEVPNVVGQTLQDAVSQLNECGFKYVRHETVDSDKEKDEVVEQSVDPYTKVDVETTIVLKVSNQSIQKDKMPNVVGRNVDDAVAALDAKDFTNVNLDYVDSDEPKDTVIEQSVDPNTEIELTAEIVLKVSNGPKETDPPMPTIVSKSVDFTFGANTTEAFTVMITCGGELVYSETFAEPGTKTVTLTLQGYGTQYYEISINDVYESTQKVDFN